MGSEEVQKLNQQAQRAVSNKTAAAKASSGKPAVKKNCSGQRGYTEMPRVTPAKRLAEKRKAGRTAFFCGGNHPNARGPSMRQQPTVSVTGKAPAGWKGAVLAGRPTKRRKRR